MPPRSRDWSRPPAPPDRPRPTALSQALDLAQAPHLTASMRRQPLPGEIVTLIRLAAGCRETLAAAAAATTRKPDFLVSAAELYLRQVMCFPGADPYRILGGSARTPRVEIRQHMRELLLWLHPDRNPRGDRALMQRVLDAWQVVNGSPTVVSARESVPSRHRRPALYRPVWISQPVRRTKSRPRMGARLRFALGLVLVAGGLVVPDVVSLNLSGLVQGLAQALSPESEQGRRGVGGPGLLRGSGARRDPGPDVGPGRGGSVPNDGRHGRGIASGLWRLSEPRVGSPDVRVGSG